MSKIIIFLEQDDKQKLIDFAAKEMRDPRYQASMLVRQALQSAQHRLHVDAANAPQAGATCPHCGNSIVLVAPETPRQ